MITTPQTNQEGIYTPTDKANKQIMETQEKIVHQIIQRIQDPFR